MNNLIVVESPGKVKKVRQYAGKGYVVVASYGHDRDLPQDELGVDIDNGMNETYQITNRKAVARIKEAARHADIIYLAMDPDREGEAIAWHIREVLPKRDQKKVKRISFNAITQEAVQEALSRPGEIDMLLVDAARTRRVLDRLIGYPISRWLQDFGVQSDKPLSAGRVQTASLRIIVDRERHRRGFEPEKYYTIYALVEVDGVTFTGKMSQPSKIMAAESCQAILDQLRLAESWWVTEYFTQRSCKKAPQPLTTSAMQQAASKRLRLTPGRSQEAAQQLYEAGLTTYLRTDSVRVAPQAQAAARAFITNRYGPDYIPEDPPELQAAAGAQDAHECIRPTNVGLQPAQVAGRKDLTPEAVALYGLIWQIFVASQMLPAVFEVTNVLLVAGSSPDEPPLPYTFIGRARARTFEGFEIVFEDQPEEDQPDEDEEEETNLFIPVLSAGDRLSLRQLTARERQTRPRPRYTQATLIKALENSKIGRPSTYAGAVDVLLERGYAEMKRRNIVPTGLGEQVLDLLVAYYPQVFDLAFTASLEGLLDEIARGNARRSKALQSFHNKLLAPALQKAEEAAIQNRSLGRACPQCGAPLVRCPGKNGPFAGCSTFPACKYTCNLDLMEEAS